MAWPPLKNASFLAIFPIYDSTGCLVKGGAGLAASVSHDGGAFFAAACAVAELNASSGVYKLPFSASQMNADTVTFKVFSATGSAREYVGAIYTDTRQVSDLLSASTVLAELSQAQPASAPTISEAVMLLYMALRNSASTTTTEYKITNNAGTVIAKSALSDSGSVFERAKMQTGP